LLVLIAQLRYILGNQPKAIEPTKQFGKPAGNALASERQQGNLYGHVISGAPSNQEPTLT
jgi:hypothetical protein